MGLKCKYFLKAIAFAILKWKLFAIVFEKNWNTFKYISQIQFRVQVMNLLIILSIYKTYN